jgi:hypothetical protein
MISKVTFALLVVALISLSKAGEDGSITITVDGQ